MTREEAINQLQDAKDGYKEYLSNDAIDMAIDILEQEPKKAIWIERSDIPRGCGEYLCSNCMDEYGTDLLYAYCPDCGAYHGKNKEIIKEEDFGKCDMKMINRGKCILCGKKLAEGLLFFCKECNK